MNGDLQHPDDPKLWEILGKARPSGVSPFFSRNVIREIRCQEGQRDKSARWRWSWRLLRPLAACAAIGLAVVLFPRNHTTRPSAVSAEWEMAGDVEVEILIAFDDLLAMEENTLWIESASF